jgi:hypothetical protein
VSARRHVERYMRVGAVSETVLRGIGTRASSQKALESGTYDPGDHTEPNRDNVVYPFTQLLA